jgi:hypothetical protein
LTIKSDGWFPVAAGPPDPTTALCEDYLYSGTDSAPFMRGFSPPPTALTDIAADERRVSKKEALDAMLQLAAEGPDLLAVRRQVMEQRLLGGAAR